MDPRPTATPVPRRRPRERSLSSVRQRQRTAWIAAALLVLTAVSIIVVRAVQGPGDPATRTVDQLLRRRADRVHDETGYSALVSTSVAEALAAATTGTASTGESPIPRWRSIYLVARASDDATVAVVWEPSDRHPGWARATLFLLARDEAAAFGWRVRDARELSETETIPPEAP